MDHLLQHSISIVLHDFRKSAIFLWYQLIELSLKRIPIISSTFLLSHKVSFLCSHSILSCVLPCSRFRLWPIYVELILLSMFRYACFPKTQPQLTTKSRNSHTVSILTNYFTMHELFSNRPKLLQPHMTKIPPFPRFFYNFIHVFHTQIK